MISIKMMRRIVLVKTCGSRTRRRQTLVVAIDHCSAVPLLVIIMVLIMVMMVVMMMVIMMMMMVTATTAHES